MPELLVPLAHHPLVESLVFFVPVVLIAAVLAVMVIRDRRMDAS
jgi:hypothetical protein